MKALKFIGSSLDDLRNFPDEAREQPVSNCVPFRTAGTERLETNAMSRPRRERDSHPYIG